MSTPCLKQCDRDEEVKTRMPYAKAISAKMHLFYATANQTQTDFRRMVKSIQEAGFSGYVDSEYEGGFMNLVEPGAR